MRQINQKTAIYGQPGGTQKQAQIINQYSGTQNVPINEAAKQNQRFPAETSSKTNSRLRGASQSQITAATSTPNVVQGHNKTKSTQLTSGPNGLQNILQYNSYPAVTQLSGNQSDQNQKIMSKHTRHVSGPTSGNGPMQQQLLSQIQTMTASQPDTLRVSINLGSNQQPRTQKPSTNVSTIIVNKANSNKMAIQKEKNVQNNGGQKVQQIIDTYADNSEQIIQNQYNVNAGHKKSVSMANSKIAQLLLKAGQGQLQNKAQKAPAESKPKTKLQKKTKLKDYVLQNDNYQNSFEIMKNDGIAKSFGIPQVIHEISDEDISRILTFDDGQINRLDPSYNDLVRFNQSSQNNSGQNQSLSVERTVPVKNINITRLDKQPPQQNQQLLFTPLQMVIGQQQIVAPKESIGTVYGVEKIKQQSKIVSSGDAVKKPNSNCQAKSQGISSLGARSSVIGQQKETTDMQSLNLELNNGAVIVSANHHQRIKSDQLYIQKAINNFGVNAVQQQQKKVGEILKNNFLEVVQSTLLNGSAPTAKQTLTNIGSSNTTSANPKLIKSFAIHENNLTSQTQVSQICKTKTANNISKQVQNDLLSNAIKGQLRKSTKEKYNELKQQYDDLAEKYKAALAATQAQNSSGEQNNTYTRTGLSAGQKVDVKSSVSSLSGQTLSSNNVQYSGVMQNKINQRVVRYIHKQRTPNNFENSNHSQFRPGQDLGQNIKIENDFEWADSMPVDHDARQVMNPAPINTNSDFNKVESKEQKVKLSQSVVAQPPKIILSTREHQDERIHLISQGVQKQRQIISAKQKSQRHELNKTPDSNASTIQSNIAVSQYLKQSEAFTNNVESQVKSKKLELSNRHRRSVSDGNEPSAQFKFNQGVTKKQIIQNEMDNQQDQQNRILFVKVANRLSEDAKKQMNVPSATQHIMQDQIQENWDFEQSVVKSIESVGSFGQRKQQFQNSKQQAEQVVNQINQLRVQHNRLKSDELASNKQRIKSNQMQLVSSEKPENPTNEGNIQTPSLDTQVKSFLTDMRQVNNLRQNGSVEKQNIGVKKQRGLQKASFDKLQNSPISKQIDPVLTQKPQINRERQLTKSKKNVPQQDLHQYIMQQSQQKASKQMGELPNPQINNLIHSNQKQLNQKSSRTKLEEEKKTHSHNALNKLSASEGREMKVNPTQHMVIHRPSQSMQVHPLIQQTLNTHHSKNKLSNTSGSQTALDHQHGKKMSAGQQLYEQLNSTQSKVVSFLGSQKKEKRIVSIGESKQSTSNHKRVKSDGVEYRQSKIIQMGQSNHLPSVSFINLPVKDKNKLNAYENDQRPLQNLVHNVPQYQPITNNFRDLINPQNFFIGNNALDGTSDDRKLVNVSIDLINEDGQDSDLGSDDNGNGYYQGGQWFEVKQLDGKETCQNAKENFVLQLNQQRIAVSDVRQSLNSGPPETKHRREISIHSKSSEERLIQPQNDLKMSTDKMRLDKYKNMLLKANNKFQSKSEVPQQIVIQDDFQIDADSSQYFMNTNQRKGSPIQMSTKLLKEKHHQASRESLEFLQMPALARDPQGNQVNISMNFPSRIKSDKAKSLNKEQSQKVVKKFDKKTPDQTYQKRKVVEAKQQQKETKLEIFVPTNSIAQSLADNHSDLNASMHNLNIIMSQPVDQDLVVDRLLTQDSINNDPTLSPREKIIKKLTKYIVKNGKGTCTQSTIDFYRIGKVLGKGAFGKVNLALHHLTKRMVAIKSINKSYFNEESQSTKVKQEVVILKQTRHRNIVRLYEYFETQKHILFVIEICPGGDLLNYVRKRRQLKEDIAKSVFRQLIDGIGYCHSKNILHRDIKLDNILLAWNGEVKICDFGVSKVVRKGEIMTEQCGTPAYIAPEILMDKGYEGFSVDIWSAGVVLYAMLYGTVPFKANNMSELQKIIIKAQYQLQDCISKEARNLLEGLLEKDPLKRLTVKQILKHPWMKDAKETVELFTSAEQNYIKNEYTYANTDRYNRNEPDNFMDGALDTDRNSILKNAETKSIILAPFNSTKSHIESSSEFLTEIQEMMQSRSCIFFVGKVREIDKQYEVNNNADLDNGVYHDFGKDEEEKANQNQSPEKESVKQTEMEILENMIRKEESQNHFTQGSDEKPYECVDEEGIPNTKQLQPSNSKKLMNKGLEPNEAEYFSSQPSQNPHGLMPTNTLTIDNKIVEQVVQYGFKQDLVIKSLNNNELNSATTCYFLLCLPDIREEVRKLDEIRQVIGQSASSGSLSRKV